MAATECIKAYRHVQEVQLFSDQVSKCDLSDFDRGMIVDARQGGLNITETPPGIFTAQQSLEFAENVAKKNCRKKKHAVNSSSMGKKCVVNERSVEKCQVLCFLHIYFLYFSCVLPFISLCAFRILFIIGFTWVLLAHPIATQLFIGSPCYLCI